MSSVACALVVAGRVDDWRFQAARLLGEELAQLHANVTFEVKALFGTAWEEFAQQQAAVLQLEAQAVCSPFAYYNVDHRIGALEELREWAGNVYDFKRPVDEERCEAVAASELRAALQATKHAMCYLDVAVAAGTDRDRDRRSESKQQQVGGGGDGGGGEDEDVHRVVIELFDDVCPVTCANFAQICGADAASSACAQSYKGTPFHRAVDNGWVQGGDVVDGSGLNSVCAGSSEGAADATFADENFAVKHARAGVVSMATQGKPHTNGSQFFVALAPLPWLDRKRVAFGQVIYGMHAFRSIAALPRKNERPQGVCEVVDCGPFTVDTPLAARPIAKPDSNLNLHKKK